MAVADPEKQLAWEGRQRKPAGIMALLAALLTIGAELWSGSLFRDVPRGSYVESLEQLTRPGPIGDRPSVRLDFFEFYDQHASAIFASNLLRALGYVALAWVLTFLAAATRARREQFPRFGMYVGLIGGILYAISTLVGAFAIGSAVSNFLDGPRTVAAATQISSDSLLVTGQFIGLAAQVCLATGFVLICLNAMRAGLLTRFMGILGVITGVLVIVPIALLPVQMVWLIAIAALLLGVLPGGEPAAWRTGREEPWPSQQEIAAQRRAAAEARRGGKAAPEPEPEAVPAGPEHPASKKRKRKRRG
jgi:hypothetical protein